MSLQERFKDAAENLKKLQVTPKEDELLEVYSLYKQAEVGDCNIPKPGLLDFKGKAKWEAWTKKAGVSKEDAMKEYITKVEDLIKRYAGK